MQTRRLISGLEIPRKKDGLPSRFQDQDDQTDQLRRCLTATDLPLEVRIVGALVRLYAIPVARIVELTIDRFDRDDTHAYLVIEKNAVVLPPSLAALIEELIARQALKWASRLGARDTRLPLPRQATEPTSQHQSPGPKSEPLRTTDTGCPQLGDDRQRPRSRTNRGQ